MTKRDEVMQSLLDGDLPDGMAFADGFPADDVVTVLVEVKNVIRAAAVEAGYEVTGSGVGCGGEDSLGEADVGLRIAGRRVEVRIYVPRDRQ